MKTQTAHRILLALVGIVLSASAAFVGAGLTSWAVCVYHSGLRTPEMFGWIGIFLVVGWIGLILAAPALLTMVAIHIVRCSPLGWHVLLSGLFSLVLGGTAVVVCVLTDFSDATASDYLTSSVVPGATCLAIVLVVEFLLKKNLRNQLTSISVSQVASQASDPTGPNPKDRGVALETGSQ